jgi:hypothetical protein
MVTSTSTSTAPPTTSTPKTAPLLDQKIDMITASLPPSYGRNLRPLCAQNVSVISSIHSCHEDRNQLI